MPALPDRSGRPLPDTRRRRGHRWRVCGDQRGPRARATRRGGHAARGDDARVRRLDAQRRDRPRRLQVGTAPAGQALRRGDRPGALPDTLDGYETVKRLIAEEAIDCDFREVGHLELAYAPSHVRDLEQQRESLASVGVASHDRAARADPRGDRLRRVPRRARRAGQRAAPPGPLLRRAGRRRRSRRRRPARGRPRPHDPAAGRRSLRRRDRARRDPRPGRARRHQRLHGRRRTRRCAGGSSRSASYIIASEPLPEDLVRELSPKGRAFFDTKNFLYYWHVSADRRMVFGGRASFMPTSVDHTAAILHRGLLEVHPQLAGRRIDYAWGGNVGFTFDRMPHAGRTGGRRRLRDGLLRDGRRADDPPRHGDGGVAGGR